VLLLVTLLLLPEWRRPDLDRNRVVVFPPVDSRDNSASAQAGLDVALAIEAALDHAHPLRWDDGWDRLEDPVRRDPLLLTAGMANRISQDRGAAYYIDGVIGTDGDSATVLLHLHDVDGDSLLAVERSAADSAGVVYAALALRAVTGLLPELVDPGLEIDLSALTDRDPGAIALWIQGEREYRLFHFSGALDLYRRALAEDSLLVFAAIKGAQAAGWELHYAQVEELIDVAVSHDTLLPPRYGHLAHGIQAYSTGQADTAIQRFEAALELDPHWSEAAAALGETYYHLIPAKGNTVPLAETMFARALIPDTAFSPPLLHLAEIAIRKAEVDRAGRLLRALAAVQPDSSYYRHALLMLDCVEGGADEMAWEEAAASEPRAALASAYELAAAASDVQCAKSGFRAILVENGFPSYGRETGGTIWSAVLGLQGLLVAEGRHGEAVALLDSAVSGGLSQAYSLYLIDFLAGAPMELEAQKVKTIVSSAFGEHYERAGPQLHWLMGAWHAWHGEVEKVAQISADLDSMAEESGDPRQRLFADALASHLSLARGDTTDAIERLRALRPNATRATLIWGLAESLAVERLLLAELLLARGEYEEAHDVTAVFDHPAPYIYLPFLSRSLTIRLEAAESMGRGDLADRYRQRLQALGRVPT
jgi:tetratricopeptide (TPR) repeat protein